MLSEFRILLDKACERKGMSYSDLGKSMGHNKFFVSRVLSGRRKLREAHIEEMAELLELKGLRKKEFVLCGLLAIGPQLVRDEFKKL